MADPNSLYNFIKWGANNYPADCYMLILGGHAFQYVGMMTDYSQDAPYIMGLSEIVQVIDLFKKDTGNNIDLLVLDTCGMNSVEVIYEFGMNVDNAVKNILTFIDGGPIAGLPYDKLIYLLQQNSQYSPNIVAKKIIQSLQLDLIAIKVDFEMLQKIKKAASELASYLLNNNRKEKVSSLEKLISLNNENSCNSLVNDLNESLWSVIIHYKCVSPKQSNLIAMPTDKLIHPMVFFYYYKLGFARNNYWNHLLLDIPKGSHFFDINICPKPKPMPIMLSKQVLLGYIAVMNPSLNQKEQIAILNNLLNYKDWGF